MDKNLEKIIKKDADIFKNAAKHPRKDDFQTARLLSDNFYMLERHSVQILKEIKHAEGCFKGSEVLPSLFEKCREMCDKGILPSEDEIIAFFKKRGGLNGLETELLALAIECVLTDSAASGIKSESVSGAKQLANAIVSLRKISEIDFDYIIENLYIAQEYLERDKLYSSMDEYSKSVYRKRLFTIARRAKKSEKEIAEEKSEKAEKSGKHIGCYLLNREKSKRNGYIFLAMELIMPAATAFCVSVLLNSWAAGLLLFIPLWEICRYPVEAAAMRAVPPHRLLRLSADCDIVKNTNALITVSTILPTADKMSELEKHLEKLYLSNCTDNIKICCLADFKAAGMPRKPEDKNIVKSANEMLDRLNKKYGGGFILAVRPRMHSKTQNEFIGRERKRGAITELVRAIKGSSKGFSVFGGDTEEIQRVKYLITLDADTELVFDSVKELIAVAEHPLNMPVIKKGRVVEGYGILAPKTETGLKSKNHTVFSRLAAGDSGIVSYDLLTGERYHNLFGESIFCGKGLINVDAYYSLLDVGLPKEMILSHDIVESGFLRTGFVSEVQITESIPKSVLSYFGRMHRWVRGDWQNIKFVFGKNPLNFVSRYKMFDNLRRSLTPIVSVAALVISAFTAGAVSVSIALTSMLSLMARNLYPALCSFFRMGFSSISRLTFSKTLPHSLHLFVKSFISLAFSAREAFVCADAIVKSLWRVFVSKKKLLEWTTAAQGDKNSSLIAIVVSCIPSMMVAFILLMFGTAVQRLAGLILLADIPAALFASSEIKHEKVKISEKQREELVSYAAAMWGFFEDLCNRKNNFLPPDNIQFSPVKATAHRTSPTNIGLMLASLLSARDMGFITTAELYMRLKLSLGSIEKLEKYKGNLLNWYDTQTLNPLNPKFVSTVDSGNFLCCLTAVKEGLKEYVFECTALKEIIERIEKLISDTDIGVLFNKRKMLFHIGLDPCTEEKSNSYYDLYMSEARMTAYYAVARRAVPKKHWGALGRVYVGSGRYVGLASWSGTMFEFFMPNLFIPSPEGSLSREALRFCLYCQKNRVRRLPFGISESGFYAFDSELNYQYKAHGVGKLALKREEKSETVISPYSTFLCLTEAPILAMKNLKKLEKYGMNGIYGFYEAIDFTKGRGGADGAIIRSYMAHHVGMSMVAVNNLLGENRMQKRFMNDGYMKGAQELLNEKIQTDSKLFKDIKAESIPNVRERVYGKERIFENPTPFSPEAMILTNGRMTTCISDIGAGVTVFDGVDVTVNSGDPFTNPQGVFAVFKSDKDIISFTNATDRLSKAKYSVLFMKNGAEHTAKKGNILLKMQTALLEKENCEIRKFTVENLNRKEDLNGKLIIYFEPCIEKREVYASHPMYSKLFLIDEWDSENNCVIFSRNAVNESQSCCIAAGILENIDCGFEASREKVLMSPDGIFSLGFKSDFNKTRGNPDCCAAFEIEIKLEAGRKKSFTLGIAVAQGKERALNTLLSVRAGKSIKKRAVNPLYSDLEEKCFASKILPKVLFPPLERGKLSTSEKCIYSKNDLWSLGISGTNPIITVNIGVSEKTDEIIPYVKFNRKLRSCGIKTDLVIVYSGEDGYLHPISNSLKKLLEHEDCGLMLGVNGGVHFVNSVQCEYIVLTALKNSSTFYLETDKNIPESVKNVFRPLKFVDHTNKNSECKFNKSVKEYNFTDGKIVIEKNSTTVDIPWNHTLANECFGTMVSDKALGFTWAFNSRENKLTPWSNDLMCDNRGEMLIMKYNGVLYDLTCLGKAEFTPEYAIWSGRIVDIEYKIKMTVAKRGMVKKCSVKITNKSACDKSIDIMYYVEPVLGVAKSGCGMLYAEKNEKGATLKNSFSDINGYMNLSCDEKAEYICFSKEDFFEGRFSSDGESIIEDCCIAIGNNAVLQKNETKNFEFCFSWASCENAARLMPSIASYGSCCVNPVKIESKNKNLELFFNSFLYSQIKQTRFFARTGFYQCSGAYGFRDQLQDSLAFIDFEPKLTLRHIARCCTVQFEEGDVLHWWHIITNKTQQINGVRTKCSDDMLWLPYVCIEYAEKTGDYSFLDIKTAYISGEILGENEKERYFSPQKTNYKESILEHCIKAVDKSLNFGKNGLPLIGSCDWNDGFDKIGESNAESVWLAMFQVIVLERMSKLCLKKGKADKGNEYLSIAAKLRNTIESKAWCGDRYARIILENGDIFGKDSDFIDVLPQAFAVFMNADRKEIALDTALKTLFDGNTVRLLSPPFDVDDYEKVGYIAAYPNGIRENGGQYTHAGVWLTIALFSAGRIDEAQKMVNALNSLSFYVENEAATRYRAEPYVLAGDVSCGKRINGRAGWTHFTGSAAWYYRCIYNNYDKLDCKIVKRL